MTWDPPAVSESISVRCAACGSPRPDEDAQRPGTPCAQCGSTTRDISVVVTETIGAATDSVSYTARTTNATAAKLRQLTTAADELANALAANHPSDCQRALKHALTAVHELNDRLKDEWDQDDWDQADVALWKAHLGARNRAHHGVDGLIALHSHPESDNRLVWDLSPDAVDKNQSATGKVEFRSLLAGQPVLPALRRLAARAARSIT